MISPKELITQYLTSLPESLLKKSHNKKQLKKKKFETYTALRGADVHVFHQFAIDLGFQELSARGVGRHLRIRRQVEHGWEETLSVYDVNIATFAQR